MAAQDSSTSNIVTVVDSSPFSPRQAGLIAILMTLLIVDGFDGQVIGFVIPTLSKEWELAPAVFGILLTIKAAAAVGGAVLLGMFGDRYGRRPAILIAVAMIAAFTLLSTTAHDIGSLTMWQALASFGVGGILPSCVALASEFAPLRLRATIVTVVGACSALGGFLGALLAAAVLPRVGASGMFLIGGIAAATIGVAAVVWLPESAQFSLSQGNHVRALATVRRIITRAVLPSDFRLEPPPAVRADLAPVAEIFARGLRFRTILLWGLFFMVFLVGYLVFGWMPTIFSAAGVTSSTALVAVACFNIGGVVGGVLIGRAIDRTGQPALVLIAGLVVAGIATTLVAATLSNDVALWLVCAVIGLGNGGAYGGIAAIASATYPVRARSTGVGWAYGVGRIGSIVGPAVGGVVLGAGLAAGVIFASLLLPIGCAILCLVGLWQQQGRRVPIQTATTAVATRPVGRG